jgi:hypothetical protein
MDFFGALLSLPIKVASDILSPRVRDWLSGMADRRKHNRIRKLRTQLARLTDAEPSAVKSAGVVKQPNVVFADISLVGMYPNGTDAEWRGQAFFVVNIETRLGIPAYKMEAHLTFKSARGRTIEVQDAPWFQNHNGNPQGRHFKTNVTLGTIERAGIVLLIEIGGEFLTARYGSDLHPMPDKVLPPGEWNVTLRIDGHNVDKLYDFTLQLVPNNFAATMPVERSS